MRPSSERLSCKPPLIQQPFPIQQGEALRRPKPVDVHHGPLKANKTVDITARYSEKMELLPTAWPPDRVPDKDGNMRIGNISENYLIKAAEFESLDSSVLSTPMSAKASINATTKMSDANKPTELFKEIMNTENEVRSL